MYVLDTNIAIAIMQGKPATVRPRLHAVLSAGVTVFISSIVAYELWYSVAKSARVDENTATLKAFLSGGVDVLPLNSESAAIAGQIRATLKLRGAPIGPYDLLIAAHAIALNSTLVTSNVSEFSRVEGLNYVDWSA